MNKKLIIILSCALALLIAVGSAIGVASCVKNQSGSSESLEIPEDEGKKLEKSGYKLVKGGISEYKILLPKEPRANELVAAEELQSIMMKATEAELPIVYESDEIKDIPVISIGQTQLALSKGLKAADYELNRSGYYIKTVDHQLFILGGLNFSGLGCVYGVYDLLEDCVGYKYFHYDEVYYEQKSTVYLYKYDDVVIPSFDFRSTSYSAMNDLDYVRRLRIFGFNEEYGWKAHTQTDLVVDKNVHTDHLYGATKVVDGKTVPDHWFAPGANQLCWTAGAEMELQAAKDIYVNIQANPDKIYFQIGQADNSNYCSCERCEQAKKDWAMNDAGLQINFANHVVEIVDEWVKRDYPEGRDVRVIIFAYMGTDEPPVVEDGNGGWRLYSDKVRPHEKLYFEYAPIYTNYADGLDEKNNPDTYTNLKKWSSILGDTGRLTLWTYETNFSYFMYNFNNFATFKAHMQVFEESGIDYVFSQGPLITNQPCFQELRLYVESRIMWDVNRDYKALVEEFMNAFYKDVAPEMTEYYNFIRLRYEQMETLYDFNFDSIYSDIGSKDIWTEGVVDKISDIFDRAYAKLEPYKATDKALYTKLYERVKELELTNIYTILTHYNQNYEQEEINEMVEEFNYYTSKFGITHYREGEYYTSGMFDALKE